MGCNKCLDEKEYCGTMPACFEKGLPKCPAVAVIPSMTLDTTEGLKQLSNTVVHVISNNTTYYVDDKHRITEICSEPVSRDNYDFANNPENFAGQIVFDYANNIAFYYDNSGRAFEIAEDFQGAITAEANARIAADNDLQTEIDNLKNSPDVVDIVDTYADLEAYDTQHLGDNDIIRILTDETHDGESSYYRWDKHNETWTFIGSINYTYTGGNGIDITDNEVSVRLGRGLAFDNDGDIDVSEDYIIGYNSVDEMKSADNLIAGSYARTLGYYSANDGGGALYKIRAITNDDVVDESTIIEMGDGSDELVAELIVESPINVKVLGAYGDGSHDDYAKIQLAITKFPQNTIYIPTGVYVVSQPLSIGTTNAEQVDLKLEADTVIKTNTSIDSLLEIGKLEGSWYRGQKGAIVTIDGGIFDGTNTQQGIYLASNRKNTTLKNLVINNVSTIGIKVVKGTNTSESSDAVMDNISINGTGSEGSSIGIQMAAYDNKLSNIRVNACTIGIDDYSGNFYQNVHCLAAWTTGSLNETNYEKTIGFKFRGQGISKLNECYSDTFGTGFQFDTAVKVHLVNCQSYHYLTDVEYETVLFKDNETNANLRLIVDDFDWTPPSVSGAGVNYGLDLRSTNSNFRNNLTTFDCFKFSNILINEAGRIDVEDYINCLSLYPDNTFTNANAWVKTMTANVYYPIAILKGGGVTYDMDIQMGTDQAIKAVIYTAAAPTITITNLKSAGHAGKYSLAICNTEVVNGVRRSILCIKTTAVDSGFNPSFQNFKCWNSQVFSKKGYSGTPLDNPTVNTEASFNP